MELHLSPGNLGMLLLNNLKHRATPVLCKKEYYFLYLGVTHPNVFTLYY